MIRTVFRVFVLLVVVATFALANDRSMPWGPSEVKSTTTESPTAHRRRDRCPEPTEELKACISQWACQYLVRLDLRCLLNLNGLPLVGNALGGLLGGGGGQSPARPALGGSGGGLLGGSGGGLLGGSGGLLGGLLG